MSDADLTIWMIAARLAAAAIGGAALGYERERRDKPAGLRTIMLVSVGAAATMLLTIDLCQTTAKLMEAAGHTPNLDPTRAIAGVIGGIGFLGAGSIFKSRGDVEGLTTAAAIWTSGAIGLACGAGRFAIAATTALLALAILHVIGQIERTVLKTKGNEIP